MAKEVTGYKVVTDVDFGALEAGVMEYAKLGYVPVGGPFVFNGAIGQAIVKKEQKKP